MGAVAWGWEGRSVFDMICWGHGEVAYGIWLLRGWLLAGIVRCWDGSPLLDVACWSGEVLVVAGRLLGALVVVLVVALEVVAGPVCFVVEEAGLRLRAVRMVFAEVRTGLVAAVLRYAVAARQQLMAQQIVLLQQVHSGCLEVRWLPKVEGCTVMVHARLVVHKASAALMPRMAASVHMRLLQMM